MIYHFAVPPSVAVLLPPAKRIDGVSYFILITPRVSSPPKTIPAEKSFNKYGGALVFVRILLRTYLLVPSTPIAAQVLVVASMDTVKFE